MLLAELQMRLSALTSDKHLCPICGTAFDTLGLTRSHEFSVHTDAFKANLRASGDTFAQDPPPGRVECQVCQLFTVSDKYLQNYFQTERHKLQLQIFTLQQNEEESNVDELTDCDKRKSVASIHASMTQALAPARLTMDTPPEPSDSEFPSLFLDDNRDEELTPQISTLHTQN